MLTTGKSGIDNVGIFATKAITKSSVVSRIEGTLVNYHSISKAMALAIPTWYGVRKDTWLDPGESIFRYLNHSCDPNTAIIDDCTLVARRDIKPNEEVTIDYSMTDEDEYWAMYCTCGSSRCRGKITSIQSIDKKTFLHHYPLIPRYFVDLYVASHPDVGTLLSDRGSQLVVPV